MQRILILIALSTLIMVNCKSDDNTGDLSLKVTATYDGQPFVNLDQSYTYPDGTPVKFQLFNYYLSDITLMKETTASEKDQLLSDVELIQYADFYTTTLAEQGILLEFKDIPDGQYQGLRFGIGLAPDLNATQPSDHAAGHALTKNFWSWARGYVFAKIEGNADLDGDGDFTDKLTYHIGDNDLYKTVELNTPIQIENGKLANTNLIVDVLDVIQNAQGDYLDINDEANTLDHTNNDRIYGFLWNNLTQAIELKE